MKQNLRHELHDVIFACLCVFAEDLENEHRQRMELQAEMDATLADLNNL